MLRSLYYILSIGHVYQWQIENIDNYFLHFVHEYILKAIRPYVYCVTYEPEKIFVSRMKEIIMSSIVISHWSGFVKDKFWDSCILIQKFISSNGCSFGQIFEMVYRNTLTFIFFITANIQGFNFENGQTSIHFK